MKFAMMYSCGKDSALALHRMIAAGHIPVCLVTTYNKEADRSWFHGVASEVLNSISESLSIPILRAICTSETYQEEVERCLSQAKEMGAEAVVFGDIDIEDHLTWDRERCENVGLECVLPLWNQDRAELVAETIAAGFKAAITCVDLSCLDESFLGETLRGATVARIAATGSDVCGENGEYHTLVYDGPFFGTPIPLRFGEKISLGTHAVISISLDK